MTIHPNPNQGQFTIVLCDGESREVIIYDMMGKVIYNQQLNESTELELTHQPKGIYYIKAIAADGKAAVTKMILSR